jgi:hypothetical protein
MVCLRELALEFGDFLPGRGDFQHAFQCALRKNGYIRAVPNARFCFSAKCESRTIVEFDSFGYYRMQSYCDRNRLAPELLHRLCWNDDSAAFGDSQTLVPSLRKVVTRAPRTAPTIFLTGLLVSFDYLGLNRDEHLCRMKAID